MKGKSKKMRKRKMKMNKYMKFLLLVLFVGAFFSYCTKSDKVNSTNKELIVLMGSNDTEINSDLRMSVDGVKQYLNENEIQVTYLEDTNDSGYLLKFKSEEKRIESAMTDIDLLEICKEFYEIY